MPAAEYDREIRIPLLDRFSNLDCFTNHRSGDQRDSEAESVLNLFKNALFVVGSDRRVDDADVVSRFEQRRRDGKDSQRSRSLNAGERGDKEDDLFRRFHLSAFRSFKVRRTAW